MRNTPSNSAENAKGNVPEPAVGWATRTKTDATGLLVEFARALKEDAQLLVMDEPTRGVDVGARVDIYRILEELVEEGAGIVMS